MPDTGVGPDVFGVARKLKMTVPKWVVLTGSVTAHRCLKPSEPKYICRHTSPTTWLCGLHVALKHELSKDSDGILP